MSFAMKRGARTLTAAIAGIASLAAAGAFTAQAGAVSVSSNWAGYLATHAAGSPSGFSSVAGSWREPSITCSAGREGYSAVWVGLGGDREDANALEQAGTDADCSRSGTRPGMS
jgi:hypothetical protein